MSRLGSARRRALLALLGVDLRGELGALRTSLDERIARSEVMADNWSATDVTIAGLDEAVKRIESRQDADQLVSRQFMRHVLDDIDGGRRRLAALRHSEEYATAMSDREPLVTVRIATYDRTEKLMDVALPSVFAQSWQRLEVVIVNDGPNPRTRAAIEALGDPRVRFWELPERGSYPEGVRNGWLVAGTDPINAATDAARGSWVAHLDDDDEFSPDHLEVLLRTAWTADAELGYGALEQVALASGERRTIWSDPPQIDQFSFQASVYLSALRFLRYERSAWLLDEPGDWNLIRRMKAVGVKMAATEQTVGTVHMVPFWEKKS